jgi:hypothetical protein
MDATINLPAAFMGVQLFQPIGLSRAEVKWIPEVSLRVRQDNKNGRKKGKKGKRTD